MNLILSRRNITFHKIQCDYLYSHRDPAGKFSPPQGLTEPLPTGGRKAWWQREFLSIDTFGPHGVGKGANAFDCYGNAVSIPQKQGGHPGESHSFRRPRENNRSRQ